MSPDLFNVDYAAILDALNRFSALRFAYPGFSDDAFLAFSTIYGLLVAIFSDSGIQVTCFDGRYFYLDVFNGTEVEPEDVYSFFSL